MSGKWRTRGETPVLSKGFRGTSRGISRRLGGKGKVLGGEMRESRDIGEDPGEETGREKKVITENEGRGRRSRRNMGDERD